MARTRTDPLIDSEAPASRIAMLWGSYSAFARAIGKRQSTLQRHLRKGSYPPDWLPDIMAAAKRDKKRLRPEDFVDKRLANVPPAPPLGEAQAA
jgi:hypothetical protein